MKIHCAFVSAIEPDSAAAELNAFLGSHSVAKIETRFVEAGSSSYWAFCVTYMDGAASESKIRKGRIDYREVLNEADFAVFARLRSLPKGVVRSRVGSALCAVHQRAVGGHGAATGDDGRRSSRNIHGIGPARVEKVRQAVSRHPAGRLDIGGVPRERCHAVAKSVSKKSRHGRIFSRLRS